MTRRKPPKVEFIGRCSKKRMGGRLARTRVYETLDLRINCNVDLES